MLPTLRAAIRRGNLTPVDRPATLVQPRLKITNPQLQLLDLRLKLTPVVHRDIHTLLLALNLELCLKKLPAGLGKLTLQLFHRVVDRPNSGLRRGHGDTAALARREKERRDATGAADRGDDRGKDRQVDRGFSGTDQERDDRRDRRAERGV